MSYENAYDVMKHLWDNEFDSSDKLWFCTNDYIDLHFSVGNYIRHKAKLWESKWEPMMINGVDHSHEHPDAISARVVKQFQENIKLGVEK